MKKSLFFCTGKRCLSSPQPIRLSVEYQLLTECAHAAAGYATAAEDTVFIRGAGNAAVFASSQRGSL